MLRRRADILELPVQFVPLSPEKVKRTSAFEGLQALLTIVGQRFTTSQVAPPARVAGDAISPKLRSSEAGFGPKADGREATRNP